MYVYIIKRRNLNDFDAELNTHLEEYLITRREKSLFDDKNSTALA